MCPPPVVALYSHMLAALLFLGHTGQVPTSLIRARSSTYTATEPVPVRALPESQQENEGTVAWPLTALWQTPKKRQNNPENKTATCPPRGREACSEGARARVKGQLPVLLSSRGGDSSLPEVSFRGMNPIQGQTHALFTSCGSRWGRAPGEMHWPDVHSGSPTFLSQSHWPIGHDPGSLVHQLGPEVWAYWAPVQCPVSTAFSGLLEAGPRRSGQEWGQGARGEDRVHRPDSGRAHNSGRPDSRRQARAGLVPCHPGCRQPGSPTSSQR